MGELAADCRSAAGVCGAEVRGGAGTLDRLIQGGLLFRQGVLPQASYLFKHALVQDAAYGTLLREPRRALHARIAETLESRFVETTVSQPSRRGNQGGSNAGPFADRASRSAGRAFRRSLAVVSVLYAFWVANYVAFNGDAMRDFATQFLELAERQRATVWS